MSGAREGKESRWCRLLLRVEIRVSYLRESGDAISDVTSVVNDDANTSGS